MLRLLPRHPKNRVMIVKIAVTICTAKISKKMDQRDRLGSTRQWRIKHEADRCFLCKSPSSTSMRIGYILDFIENIVSLPVQLVVAVAFHPFSLWVTSIKFPSGGAIPATRTSPEYSGHSAQHRALAIGKFRGKVICTSHLCASALHQNVPRQISASHRSGLKPG